MSNGSRYIDLDRRFRQLDPRADPEREAVQSYTATLFLAASGLAWNEILARTRVVVLGEPGSGKTWEFRERARRMREAGEYAFFVRLDQLASAPLDEVLGPDGSRLLQTWRKSRKQATFFLDSVDEAKFNKFAEFLVALDRFRDNLGARGIRQSRILISSRISEWRPEGDRQELLQRFPAPPEMSPPSTTSEGPEEDDDSDRSLLVVQLQPLDRRRVENFVRGLGVGDPQGFLAALDESHAWDFARRPLDVVELANFWNLRGRLGSLTELIEHDIGCALRERTERHRVDPLTEQQAREGAEALAAATVFCRQFIFRVPDDSHVGLPAALDAVSCLPGNWRPEQCHALLTRAIFDSGVYGRIRFHSRRIAEYLAARWFAKRMREGCPIETLEYTFFEQAKGRRVLRPSLAPVAAWLCCGDERWNAELRAWVLEASPDLHMSYGDPSALPQEYKREMLQAMTAHFEGRERLWLNADPETLSRLADPGLAEQVAAMIQDRNQPEELRSTMLQLVRHGRIVECLDTALAVIAADDEPDWLRVYAAAAVRDAADLPRRRQLAEIAARLALISSGLCGVLCEALFPEAVDPAGLGNLLGRTQDEEGNFAYLKSVLENHFEEVLLPETAGAVLAEMIGLAERPPHILFDNTRTPISTQHSWIGQPMATMLKRLLEKSTMTSDEAQTAARAVWLLGHLQTLGEVHRKSVPELNAMTMRHLCMRRLYFWHCMDEYREKYEQEPSYFGFALDHHDGIQPIAEDIEWLLADIQARDALRDRQLALRFAVQVSYLSPKSQRWRRRIGKAAAGDPSLRRLYAEIMADGRWSWIRVLWYRYVRRKLADRWWWKRCFWQFQSKWQEGRDRLWLLRHLRSIAAGNATYALCQLAWEAEAASSQAGPTRYDWTKLSEKRGRRVVKAAKLGCKRAWRQFLPPLLHEKADPSKVDGRITLGLAGIEAEFLDGDLNLAELSYEDAYRAARYAVNEMNVFPVWLDVLARYQPKAVRDVLGECVRGEWTFAPEREHYLGVLRDLASQGETFDHLILQDVRSELSRRDPSNASILEFALTLVLRQEDLPRAELSGIAVERLGMYPEARRELLLWMIVWLQLDAGAAIRFFAAVESRQKGANSLLARVCGVLGSERFARYPRIKDPDYLAPAHMRRFIPLVYHCIRPSEDIRRTGGVAYSPGSRDHAQDFRNGLIERLAASEDRDADAVLRELGDDAILAPLRDWILHLIDRRAEQQAELLPWEPSDVRRFAEDYEVDPKTDRDLFRIICHRLADIKHDVEKADNSLRDELHRGDDEAHLRRWLKRKLEERSRQRYNVPQEAEIDQQQRPDLRIENPRTDPVSIEVKWADADWSLRDLLERLENQLVGQYLRAHNSRYGVFLVGYIGKKSYWKDPVDGTHRNFSEVVDMLQTRARQIVDSQRDVADIAVLGIDFSDPRRKRVGQEAG